ncbi:MAG: hypothetical protein R3242_06125 [Akkermansiaceae bacterium]|nr:hypothetical protein [Akkermansiaceae bacterium]
MMAAAGLRPPLERWSKLDQVLWAGRLVDPWGDALERHGVIDLKAYEEQARVPYAEGLSPWVMGQPKLNLNRLLADAPEVAVDEMAEWMRRGLPRFGERAGGFPEDYHRTLAANAIDHADADSQPLVKPGHYRGIDGQPFLSEVVLHIHFQGLVREEERWVMKWTLRLFAELWNLGSEPIEGGRARLSYEVNLEPTAIGLGPPGQPFDSPELLDDPAQTTHSLEPWGSLHVTPEVDIELLPDEYRFHEFARVDYRIPCQPQLDGMGVPLPEWFDLVELEHEARGLTLFWNGQAVERLARIHRDSYGLSNFRTDRRRKTAKACIPALNYGGSGAMTNNPGDPRISHYLRTLAVGENAYPENISPHRRNIRRRNIYDRDPSPHKARHYGRVLPSQWADGGHDSATGDFRVTTSDARMPTDPEFWPLALVPTPQASHAPQRRSSRGRFLSATELGHLFDPLMWTPAYPDLPDFPGSGAQDTAELLGTQSIWQRPAMPLRRGQWPEVSWASSISNRHGGGHSLRIGRAEHPRFDRPGLRASDLLDLFHCGQPDSTHPALREGPLLRVAGRVNVNTASREVLRSLVHGELLQDAAIAEQLSLAHDTSHHLAPVTSPWQADAEQLMQAADAIATEIIRARPFATTSSLSHLRSEKGEAVFGNAELFSPDGSIQWSDAAAEECFARIYEQTGVRSRNFRLWVVGQAVRPNESGVEVLANVRRVYTVHLDPGERAPDGEIIEGNPQLEVRHVCDF